MALRASQKSLKDWGKQKWRTKSGKPSSKTGERYLPTKAIKALKADLKRDCIPYYKYDELCDRISSMQIAVKLKDTTKHG